MTHKRAPATQPGQTVEDSPTRVGRWLLLIHQIPPKPDYFRVRIGRRLQRIGAVPIKNSVYVLPNREDTYEDFEWVLREIVEGGGEASMCEASFVEGLTDDAIRALFCAARDADYQELTEAARAVLDELAPTGHMEAAKRAGMGTDLTRLRRRVAEVVEIDFFAAAGRASAEAALTAIEDAMRRSAEPSGAESPTGSVGVSQPVKRGATWVTRRDIHVDRIASGWLIRRFIDPAARFKFVPARGYKPAAGELRFDMFEAEYTHEGDRCTFETLITRFALDDPALRHIGEIVHDLDFKTETFDRDETAGVAQIVAGIVVAHAEDEARLARGGAALDDLYAAFARNKGRPTQSTTQPTTQPVAPRSAKKVDTVLRNTPSRMRGKRTLGVPKSPPKRGSRGK